MGKKSKRKTRWRSLPIGDGSSQNEEEGDDGDEGGAMHHQNGHVRKFRPNNGYRYHNNQRYSNSQTSQHSVEKKLFNEDEYTKITTPRQDVLFKKGYLGRRRPVVSNSDTLTGDSNNGDNSMENGESQDNQSEASSETVTSQDQPPIIYANGFVDPHGGPIFYLNGAYDMYEPYSGVYSSFMVPAGPGGPGSVLTAVPCQPLPLQPLEWFNTRGTADMGTGWCLVAPCPPPVPPPHMPTPQRKKRYSTDSQNCSPHSSESTGPPSSPQHEDEVAELMSPELYAQIPPPAYVYPGYMFGPAVYNVNGVAVPGPTPVPSNGVTSEGPHVTNGGAVAEPVSTAAQSKRRKKKRRRKRRRGFRGEGAGTDEGSEESSSEEGPDEKEAAEDSVQVNGGNATESLMSQSSPGSGSDSTPASLPPATSESCSELSTASSSHNSHDETEPTFIPVRPIRKHDATAIIEPVQATETSKHVDVCETSVVVDTDQKNHPDIITDCTVQVAVDAEAPSSLTDNSNVSANLTDACSSITVQDQNNTQVIEVSNGNCEIEENRLPTVPPVIIDPPVTHKNSKLSRNKFSRKSKHQENKSSSDENVHELRTVSPDSLSDRSTCSLRESDRVSPVPPPRRRGKNKHRPPTPCTLPNHDNLAQDISEHIINEAIIEAIKTCNIETTLIEAENTAPRPITEAVTNWLNTNPDPLISLEDVSDDEAENTNEICNQSMTGSKNGIVNPLPAPSNRINELSTDGPEKRVENISFLSRVTRQNSGSSEDECVGEWDGWDDDPGISPHHRQQQNYQTEIEELLPSGKIDPKSSVEKYYQLTHNPSVITFRAQEAWIPATDIISDSGIESGDEPNSPKIQFNKQSIRFVQGGLPDGEPFPCGACCNIQ